MLSLPATFDSHPVKVFYGVTPKPLSVEGSMYPTLFKWLKGVKAYAERVECSSAQGFPDVVAFRGNEYLAIECKLCRVTTVKSLEKSLHWQFGQIGRASMFMKLGMSYALAVGHQKEIYLIVRGDYVPAIVADIFKFAPLYMYKP